MLTQDHDDLIRFLTESAQDSASRAGSVIDGAALIREAEELMALRARLLASSWAQEQADQLQLPLEIKAAA